MAFETLLSFIVACVVILIIPGPTIILVITQASSYGRKSVLPLVIGVLLGDFTAMSLSLIGLGAVMAASAAWFSVFKWIGAVYLIYLGIKLFMANDADEIIAEKKEKITGFRFFINSFIVTSLNPKSIAFFTAFFPQFISHEKPVFSQFLVLGSIFLLLAVLNSAFYALFSERLGIYVEKSCVRKWLNRCGGIVLTGAGIFTAALKRS